MPRFNNFTRSNQRLKVAWLLPWCILVAGFSFWAVLNSRNFSICVFMFCGAWSALGVIALLHRLIWPENEVEYRSKNISATDVLELVKLKRIHKLYLRGATISKAGFQALAKLQHVDELDLSDTNFTDDESDCLRSIKGLEVLFLDRTNITDATLEKLAGLSTLRCVLLEDTGVTEEGKERLRRSIPGLFTDESYWY